MLGKPVLTNKIVAKRLNLEESKVSSVMDFFFKELNREVLECKHPYLYVKGLGTFTLCLKPVETRIKKMHWAINGHKSALKQGAGPANRQSMLDGARREMFDLFSIRRMIKERKKLNRKLRDAKALDDNKRELV